MKVLDRMLLYLRIVYSFDYYSTVEYPHEDAMPHRCGIFHARGPQPRGKVVQHDCKLCQSINQIVDLYSALVIGSCYGALEIVSVIVITWQYMASAASIHPHRLCGATFRLN